MKKKNLCFSTALIAALLLSGCSTMRADLFSGIVISSADTRTWDQEQPAQEGLDYGTVFPQETVNEITITISPENWQAIMDDMTGLYGVQGTSGGFRPGGEPGQRPRDGERSALPEGNRPQGAPLGRQPGEGGPGAGMLGGDDDQNPIWVEAEITFGEETWEHAGIRFKGNSSLRSSWSAGSLKLPFKLDFDQFEDDYPETKDQRFYGFKQLSFSSNHHDESYLREKITADLFREAGVPAAQTAFYAITVDYGEGPVYLGLYTAVEVVDDTLIETQFKYDGGNVYKPEGTGATFAEGTFTEASFDKETNQELSDYDDILALYSALHADTRISDPETWRQELEAVFDVNTFLNWLAVNTALQNWDTYGVMNHNYYLYNDPDTGQLVWIPWDNNESLKSAGGIRDALALDLSGVSEEWPLISYLRDDPVYYQAYLSYLEQLLDDVLIPGSLAERLQEYHQLIAPYVLEELESSATSGKDSFQSSVSSLIRHINERYDLVREFLLNSGD